MYFKYTISVLYLYYFVAVNSVDFVDFVVTATKYYRNMQICLETVHIYLLFPCYLFPRTWAFVDFGLVLMEARNRSFPYLRPTWSKKKLPPAVFLVTQNIVSLCSLLLSPRFQN